VGIDISERAVAHLQQSIAGAEFHVADLSQWGDPAERAFDIVQSFEVLHLILDDAVVARAIASLAVRLSARGALLVTAALPDTTIERSGYLRYRSRSFWESTTAALGL